MTNHAAIESALKTTQPCQVHHVHVPVSHLNHHHHVWPLALGGPTEADNVIVVCPTGHYNIHTLFDEYLTRRGTVPWGIIRRYALGERVHAKLGYERYARGGM